MYKISIMRSDLNSLIEKSRLELLTPKKEEGKNMNAFESIGLNEKWLQQNDECNETD